MEDIYGKKNITLTVSIAFILLLACGAGNGSDTKRASDPGDSLNGNVNKGLIGRLYVNDKNNGVMVDLATGKVVRTPDVEWKEAANFSHNTYFSAIPGRDGSEFLLTATGCQYNSEDPARYRVRDCLVMVNNKGTMISSSALYDGLWSGSKLSVDGKYVAFMYSDEANDSSPPAELFIADRTLNKVKSRTKVTHAEYNRDYLWRGFDWVPNGQIVYGYDRSIYITSPYETVGRLLYKLPLDKSDTDSFISEPKVSPDGTKIAFRHMTDANHLIKQGNVWVMNIDGTDPHRLIHTPGYFMKDGRKKPSYQVYNDHAWSPDGEYILVQEGGTSGDLFSGAAGASDNIYAIPAKSRDVPLNDEGEHGIIKIRTYYESPGNLTYRFEPYSGTITWLN